MLLVELRRAKSYNSRAMNIWGQIGRLSGRTLETLSQRKAFEVVKVTDSELELLLHSTDKWRRVDRKRIEEAWKYLEREGSLTRDQVQKNVSPRSSAYVSAILAAVPGVTYTLRPITLHLGRSVRYPLT